MANNSRARLTGIGPISWLVAVKKIDDNPQHMAVMIAAIAPISGKIVSYIERRAPELTEKSPARGSFLKHKPQQRSLGFMGNPKDVQ
jgi:hypothetical protein